VEAETLCVAFTSDWLFPPAQNREFVLALLRTGKRASYAELTTSLVTTRSCSNPRNSTRSCAGS